MTPYEWAMTPGLGRAPLLPDPVQPSPVAANPRRDLARLLLQSQGRGQELGQGPTPAGDMPVGALVRDPAGMTQRQQLAEMMALGGFPHEGQAVAGRAPAVAMGGLATLAGAPVPGVGTVMGQMARAGMENRQRDLASELTQGIAEAFEQGSQPQPSPPTPESGTHQQSQPTQAAMVDAYEAGRQAARGYQPERESRGGGDSRSSRGGSNQSRDSYAI